MSNPFFDTPILNSPYAEPDKHWELGADGQPTQNQVNSRRLASFVTPIPTPQKYKGKSKQGELFEDAVAKAISSETQKYDLHDDINALRKILSQWRGEAPKHWKVTPETARLLQHWRHHKFSGYRPFFCQLEAVEAAIWLTEVAPHAGKKGERFLERLKSANEEANPGLSRLALKLATGAGKTTVMAMLIAWQTINSVRYPASRRFTHGFLVVTPGITIKDRLRVLLPTDVDSYYQARELIPADMQRDIKKAKIVITNYHAFKQREKTELSSAGRALINGRHGEPINTVEPEGQMLQRVMGSLMSMKNIIVFNDEAHHCYREKPSDKEEVAVQDGEDKKEAGKEAAENNEAARLWISGLEIVQKKLGIARIFDLSATPFFLRGSGYREGTLFPWTMSDFSLMDAIECGIVKLPRVPIADNQPNTVSDMPKFRELWKHIGRDMPKAGRSAKFNDPQALEEKNRLLLVNALTALYGHYEETFTQWVEAKIAVPPCFIIVCNNTSTSKLVYDYISGYFHGESGAFKEGKFPLFRNYDESGNPYPRARTMLIDSHQLDSGEKLSDDFRKINAQAIERFRREALERGGALADELRQGKDLDDATILREVMNTVGKPGMLGGDIRCVVSVSMLTEGWDANTVTHVLGVRAFGTQLLCEQVIGRALRRRSYELNENNLFDVEYADVMGIPFDFTATPIVVKPAPPADTVRVHAIRPARDFFEIRFPRVMGYRVDLPKEKIRAEFTDDSILKLNPDLVGPTEVRQSGIIGETADLKVDHPENLRRSSLIMRLTTHCLQSKWRDADGLPRFHLFSQLKAIVRQWLDTYLQCTGGTTESLLLYKKFANMAADKIHAAVNRAAVADAPKNPPITAILDPYTPTGSTNFVNFVTSKKSRWKTQDRCHINYCICDSEWEAELCRVAEKHPRVKAYVKNYNLGFEVPYLYQGEQRTYIPDFILLVDDGHGEDNPLHLVVEIKGYRWEDAKAKKETMDVFWVPGINRLGAYGRWAFMELREVYLIDSEFKAKVEAAFGGMIEKAVG